MSKAETRGFGYDLDPGNGHLISGLKFLGSLYSCPGEDRGTPTSSYLFLAGPDCRWPEASVSFADTLQAH